MWAKPIRFALLAAALGTWGGVGACAHDKPPAPGAAVTPAPAKPGAPPPCEKPEPLAVMLAASSRLNPGDKGEALATVVRLYQIKGREKITGASFDEMLDRDKETLGDDLLGVQEMTINPGETLRPAVIRNPEAGYLAAVALFRKPGAAGWRAVRKLPAPNALFCHGSNTAARDEVRFVLDESRVELR